MRHPEDAVSPPPQPIGLPAHVGHSISKMRTGVVLLTVPLLDDVIQVGTDEITATGTISVVKTPLALLVRRTDGRPLQAQILGGHQSDSGLPGPIFTEPWAALRLRHVPYGAASGMWIALPGRNIRQRCGLCQLIVTITAFALAKQRRLPVGLQ